MPPPTPFRPALLVIDMQNDFCPGDGDIPHGALAVPGGTPDGALAVAGGTPDGALAVPGGRDIVPAINGLLARPAFVYRVATRDWHPRGHVSFAGNHAGKRPFVDEVEILHPDDVGKEEGKRRAYTTRLWPTHCVQGTWGAQLVDSLAVSPSEDGNAPGADLILDKGVDLIPAKGVDLDLVPAKGVDLDLVSAKGVDLILDKGTDPRVEMYSAFYDPLRVEDSGLARRLKEVEIKGEKGITHVYVVGLAYDYCVRASALDARAEGFEVVLVRDATRAVDPAPDKLAALEEELEGKGVKVRGLGDEEVAGWLG